MISNVLWFYYKEYNETYVLFYSNKKMKTNIHDTRLSIKLNILLKVVLIHTEIRISPAVSWILRKCNRKNSF